MKIVFTLDDLITIGLILGVGVLFLGLIIIGGIQIIEEELQRKINKDEEK